MTPHLLHVFATFVPGGPQVRTVRLMAGLGTGWRHSIVALDGRSQARELLPPEVEVALLDPPPRAGTLRTVRALRQLLARERPDLLLTYNWGAIEAVMAARLGGSTPVLHHEDGFGPDEALAFKRRRVWARQLFLRSVAGLVVPSITLREIATERWRVRPERVSWIPNGVRLEEFSAADGNPALRGELGIPADAVVVGFVGHLRPEKNPVRLVQAAARVECARPLHVLVLGDGPERAALERAARTAGLAQRVHLMGYREPPQPFYRAMDLLAISSDTEQMPIALLEAMASSLPVAATAVGDVARILPTEQAPFVVPVGSEVQQALGAAIGTLAADAQLRARLGRANREIALERYSFETMLTAYRRLFEATLAQARG